jgi:hypothetical protein
MATHPLSLPSIPPDLQMNLDAAWDLKDDIKSKVHEVEKPANEVDSDRSIKNEVEPPAIITTVGEEQPIVTRRELWSYYGEFDSVFPISEY